MSVDPSTVVPSVLICFNVGLSVLRALRVVPRDNKPVKHFKWKSFQHTIPARERVNSLLLGTDVNIVIAIEAASPIHRHYTAPQLPRWKREEWP
jgi:hypothetical protein